MLIALLASQLIFEAPQRINANGEPIDATIGHASPYLRDMNNDGVRDLLVAEFGDQMFDITRLPEKMQKGAASAAPFPSFNCQRISIDQLPF